MSIDVDALKASTDLVAVVGAFVSLKKRGSEYLGLCPFHADSNPSFYVIPAKGFCNCFSCGWSGDVIAFIQEAEGLDFKAACERLGAKPRWEAKAYIAPADKPRPERITSKPPPDAGSPNMEIRALGQPSKIWPYRDTDGVVLGYVCRYETEKGKEIRCWTWGARGEAVPSWGCGHWTQPRPLYGLAELAAAPGRAVVIVEGEKAAEAAGRLLSAYYIPITWPAGANAWHKADWTPLRGRTVLIWPDADPPGWAVGDKLAALLADPRGLACRVRVLDTSRMPDGWDIADAERDGWDTARLIEWAKPRARDYQQPSTAPQGEDGAASEPGPQDTDTSSLTAAIPPADAGPDEPPQAEFPPDASPIRPKKPRKPRLAVVGNNALAPATDAEPMPAELSEDSMAVRFAEDYGQDWRCVKAWNQWMHWDGEAWAEDRDDSRVEPMRQLYRQALYTPEGQCLTPEGKRKLGRQAVAYASLRYAGTDRRIRSTPEVWDCDPMMLGVPGGVIDLSAGKLIESAREQHITMRCSVQPERGECPTWEAMLRYWQGEDDEVIGFLRRYLGYSLTGDNREQCMAFFYGPAASGKGTIMRLISYLLGSVPPPGHSKFRSYHYEAPIATFLESRNDRHSTELAAMHQKRLITSEEPAAGAKWDEAKIKWLTGGSFVTARYMRGDNFSFSMTGKIIVAANHRPRLATTDASIKRRLHVIPFDHPVADEERDNNLDARLRAEAPQILNWLIEACLEWQQCGLGLPARIADSTDTYLQAEDVLAQWIDEACDRTSDSESKALYKCYCTWAEEQGEKVWSRRAWANALVERGFKTRKGTAGMRMFCNISPKLAPPPSQYQ